MHYVYATKPGVRRKLVATFDTEEQLRAYVGWATLKLGPDGTAKFEQGTPVTGFQRLEFFSEPQTEENPEDVVHNPSPSML